MNAIKECHSSRTFRSKSLLSVLTLAVTLFVVTITVLAEARPANLVKDIYPGAAASLNTITQSFTIVGGQMFFVADDETHGAELWKSDGTYTGTVLVEDIATNNPAETLVPFALVAYEGLLYFNGNDGFAGDELWVSDGTDTGTYLLKDINPTGSSKPDRFQEAGGVLFFAASDGTNGVELWKTNGTDLGTVIVKNIRIGPAGSSPGRLTSVTSTLYFAANDGVVGEELWKSDGTTSGTVLVKDIMTGTHNSNVRDLVNLDGVLLFTAVDDVHGRALWRSDGTAMGTYLVKDINTTILDPPTQTHQFDPNNLTVVGNWVLFTAGDSSNGLELWKSDGTEAGTMLVRDIVSGSGGSRPSGLTAAAGWLYFTAFDGVSGRELWRSDGMEAGTMMVNDIYPGATGSSPSQLAFIDGVLYFSADDGAHGKELWRSAGHEADTFLLSDIRPTGSSEPVSIRGLDTMLLFSADDGTYGRELWSVDLTNEAPVAGAGGPYSGNEGSAIALNGTVSDGDEDTLTSLWMSNDPLCTFANAAQPDTTVTCTDNGSFTVTLTVTDAFGAVDADSASLTVNNVAPVLQSVSGPSWTAGYVALMVWFTDPGLNDTHGYEIDWGDGTVVSGDVPPGASQFMVNHTYTTVGDYTVSIEVSDDDGGVDSVTHDVTFVEDFFVYLPILVGP